MYSIDTVPEPGASDSLWPQQICVFRQPLKRLERLFKPGMVAHACHSNIKEVETGRFPLI